MEKEPYLIPKGKSAKQLKKADYSAPLVALIYEYLNSDGERKWILRGDIVLGLCTVDLAVELDPWREIHTGQEINFKGHTLRPTAEQIERTW